MKKKSKSFKND